MKTAVVNSNSCVVVCGIHHMVCFILRPSVVNSGLPGKRRLGFAVAFTPLVGGLSSAANICHNHKYLAGGLSVTFCKILCLRPLVGRPPAAACKLFAFIMLGGRAACGGPRRSRCFSCLARWPPAAARKWSVFNSFGGRAACGGP